MFFSSSKVHNIFEVCRSAPPNCRSEECCSMGRFGKLSSEADSTGHVESMEAPGITGN